MKALIYLLIYSGSAIMLFNIVQYVRFERLVKKQWGWKKNLAGLHLPIALLVMFLAGYLAVGMFGRPDIIMAAILFGGSIFVLLILFLLVNLSDRVSQTEQLRVDLRAAEKANVAKSTFLSNMSHDIRTPLNAILGYASLAESEDRTEEEIKNYLDKIGASGRHLLDLLNDVLEMSRIESGKMALDIAPADIVKNTIEITDIFSDQMREKGIRFTTDTSGVTDRYVMCDRLRISRILMNLLSNAYKFTPEGGSVSVILSQDGSENGIGSYVLKVRDTGIGMSEEFAEKVFESFERERTSTVSGIQGTGLGMAITRRLVDMMDGTIEVESEEGKGTEFTVRADFEITEKPDSAKPGADAVGDCSCAEGKRLLLAEDLEVNREIAVMILTSMGFCVETAHDGREAVRMVSEAEPGWYDAVLMDIQMPEMDGYEATALIRDLDDPAKAALPVIALTANAFEEDRRQALESGMNGHIAKPVDKDKMMKVLREVIPH